MIIVRIKLKEESTFFIGILMIGSIFNIGNTINFKADEASKNTLTIEGKFADVQPTGQVQYNIGKDFTSMASLSMGYENSTPIIGNAFNIKLEHSPALFYISLSVPKNNSTLTPRSFQVLRNNSYILPASGKIRFSISKDTVVFNGDGAELLRCQYEMFAYANYRNKEKISAGNKKANAAKEINDLPFHASYYNSLVELKNFYSSIYASQMAILERHRKNIGEEIYLRLKYDVLGDAMSDLLKKIYFEIDLGYASSNLVLQATLLQFYKDNFWFNPWQHEQDSLAKTGSYFYSLFQYRKSYCDLYMPLMASGARLKPTFEQLYQKLLSDYPKAMLNGILGNFFFHFTMKGEFPNWAYDDALEKITDESIKDLMLASKLSKSIGNDAYNFSLRDTSNQTVTLADLKGKILVLDFWYTGCRGCAILAAQMAPILEHYKNNDKVLFVNISADQDVDQWKNSIKKGLYTHPGSLNLYTNGNGAEDEIIRYYSVRSYPTLLIIDEKGKLLSVNPPRPSSDIPSRSERFMAIINEQLEKMN